MSLSRTVSPTRVRQSIAARAARLPRHRDPFAHPPSNPITAVSTAEVAERVAAIPSAKDLAWQLTFPSAHEIGDATRACFDEHGIWPISLSYPKSALPAVGVRSNLINAITPGVPYSFVDEQAYLRAYADSCFSVTHRKAGWDCFRHIEIFAAGSVPLMIDAEFIPRHSMVHYPKAAMRGIVEHLQRSGDAAPVGVQLAFREHFDAHLTSRAMARYLLESSGLAAAERVLFIDGQLPLSPDYLSVLTLIGLKQQLGENCRAFYPVPYIYENYVENTMDLYGRGFGYTRALPLWARPPQELQPPRKTLRQTLRSDEFDAVVIGSIARNGPLAQRVLANFPADRTIWIHGEDAPPMQEAMEFMRNSGAKTFVRSVPGV